jgi:hypothetical protein
MLEYPAVGYAHSPCKRNGRLCIPSFLQNRSRRNNTDNRSPRSYRSSPCGESLTSSQHTSWQSQCHRRLLCSAQEIKIRKCLLVFVCRDVGSLPTSRHRRTTDLAGAGRKAHGTSAASLRSNRTVQRSIRVDSTRSDRSLHPAPIRLEDVGGGFTKVLTTRNS